jgi:putative transposase
LLAHLHQSPAARGFSRSRWTLRLLREAVGTLRGLSSLSGVCRRLRAWGVGRKRGRQHLTSPDPEYAAKLGAIEAAKALARAEPERVVLLYGDEATVYRQPVTGPVYHGRGRGGCHQPTAPARAGANTKHRIGAVLDVVVGRVLFVTGYCVGVEALCRLLELVRASYGAGVRIILVWDNWPVHYHERVLAAAAAQRIELLWLPTYAPWTNPIEKLWLKLKQEVVVMHRYSDQWSELKQRIADFLGGYDRPSPELLRYVGLGLPI